MILHELYLQSCDLVDVGLFVCRGTRSVFAESVVLGGCSYRGQLVTRDVSICCSNFLLLSPSTIHCLLFLSHVHLLLSVSISTPPFPLALPNNPSPLLFHFSHPLSPPPPSFHPPSLSPFLSPTYPHRLVYLWV